MNYKDIKTLGDLKKTGYKSISIKDELRNNLIAKLKNNETVFVFPPTYVISVRSNKAKTFFI